MTKGKILVVDDNQGIGLSLSRQIMRAHNGTLDLVRSDVGCTDTYYSDWINSTL